MHKVLHLNVESITVVIYKDAFSFNEKKNEVSVSLFLYSFLNETFIYFD